MSRFRPSIHPLLGHSALLVLCLALLGTCNGCGGGGGGSGSNTTPAAASSSSVSSSSAATSSIASSASSALTSTLSSALSTACNAPSGRVLEVGPGKPYTTPSQAAAAAQNGDTIRIAAGNYTGDVATWSKSNLTVCGMGGQAHLYAAGNNAGGKGIWIANGTNMVIENISFHDAKVADRNGAGIRIEPTINITLRNCGFFDNENGILTADSGNIVIERSEFARNGYGDGLSHGIYVGRANSLTVRQSFFHETKIGHNLKSRAKQSTIENSYFMDGPNGTASYQLEFPNGGEVLLRGNMVQKGPKADNSNVISFGAEGITVWPNNALALHHNTIVSTYPGGAFLYANPSISSLKLTANLFAGTGTPGLLGGLSTSSPVLQQLSNHTTQAALIVGADKLSTPRFWPATSLLSSLALSTVLDGLYLQDSPTPLTARNITGTTRLIGALQATP